VPEKAKETSPDLLQEVFAFLASLPSMGQVQNEQFGDMEFAQAIAPYLDPEDRQFIQPSQAQFVGLKEPSTLHGTNLVGAKEGRTFKIAPELHPQGEDSLTLDPGFIYALHASDANPSLFAHEFRHNSPRVRARVFEAGQSAEAFNRYEDLFHAQTPQDKQNAIDMLADWFYRDFDASQSPSEAYTYANRLAPSILQQMEKIHDPQTGPSVGEELLQFVDALTAAQKTKTKNAKAP